LIGARHFVAVAAPTVDRLSVRLVVDSYFDLFMPKRRIRKSRSSMSAEFPPRNLDAGQCEWGLSLHLESEKAGDAINTCSILVSRRRSSAQFDLLGIEPEKLDGLILSHSHRDHYGGLGRLRRALPRPDAAAISSSIPAAI